jgi:hypothetical protein
MNKKVVDIKIKPKPLGYEVSHDERDSQIVNLHLFKGKVSALDLFESGRTLMFRVKIQFAGNLAKYLPIDAAAAKETIETVDLDIELLEVFFKKKQSAQAVRAMFAPLVDKYPGVQIGQFIGSIRLEYGIFTEFVNFIQYLSYAPMEGDVNV